MTYMLRSLLQISSFESFDSGVTVRNRRRRHTPRACRYSYGGARRPNVTGEPPQAI